MNPDKKKQLQRTCAYQENNSHIKKTNDLLVNSEEKKQLRLACLYQEKHSHITQKNG